MSGAAHSITLLTVGAMTSGESRRSWSISSASDPPDVSRCSRVKLL